MMITLLLIDFSGFFVILVEYTVVIYASLPYIDICFLFQIQPRRMAYVRDTVSWLHTLLDSKVQIVGKHFSINRKRENVLGKGGFGIVWHAVDTRDSKTLAVKQVQKNPQTAIFCQRELTFMRKCKHQNIVELIDFTEDDSSYYFIMEYCPYGNLDDFTKNKDIPFHVYLGFFSDIAEGVQFMHVSEIGHRDIKPTNVLVKNERCLKLADFGISRELTDSSSGQTATGRIGSTPWMAPEIIRVTSTAKGAKYKYGLAVDIFSLALLFLSLLVHRSGEQLNAHIGMYLMVFVKAIFHQTSKQNVHVINDTTLLTLDK